MLEVIALQPQFWIIPAIFGVLILLGVLFFWIERRIDGDGGFFATGIAASAIGLISMIVWACLLIPFDSKYHVMYKLSGTVESVTNTLDGGGDGERTMTPVVKLSGYEDPIEMDNPRIVTLKGREVELVCTMQWVYQGLDITHCNIAKIK